MSTALQVSITQPLCDSYPPNLSKFSLLAIHLSSALDSVPIIKVGELNLNLAVFTEDKIQELLAELGIEAGGKWKPKNCKARHRVAILVPARDRQQHLQQFLFNMHPIFVRQQLSYGIYVVEPVKTIPYNKALTYNIAFLESNRDTNNSWDCHTFHDVDMLPFNDHTLYNCPQNPTLLSSKIKKNGPLRFLQPSSVAYWGPSCIKSFILRSKNEGYFGGAVIMKPNQFIDINGYSNLFFGWGREGQLGFFQPL
jgi:beta-1,4-galactosyltransferase 1